MRVLAFRKRLFNNDFVRSVIRGFNSGISYLISNNQVAPEYIKLLAIKHFDLIESALKQDGFNEIIGQIEAMITTLQLFKRNAA